HPRRTATISHKPAFPERPKGADDIPVMLAAGFLPVGSHETVPLFRPGVAESVILFPGVEEIVIVNCAELVFPGFAQGFIDEGFERRAVTGTESPLSSNEFIADRAP